MLESTTESAAGPPGGPCAHGSGSQTAHDTPRRKGPDPQTRANTKSNNNNTIALPVSQQCWQHVHGATRDDRRGKTREDERDKLFRYKPTQFCDRDLVQGKKLEFRHDEI